MIRLTDIQDIEDGKKQMLVTVTRDLRTKRDGTFIPAGEYPFVYDPNDRFGLTPIVKRMLEAGMTETDEL